MTKHQTELVVVGGGPGGYAAAFYAAEKGMQVTLVEMEERLGGVCLHRGCIPSKSLLHVARLISEAKEARAWGVDFGSMEIDLARMRAWKDSVIDKLATGITSLAGRRNVAVMTGRGYFEDATTLRVETGQGQQFVAFQRAVIAVGSRPALPSQFDLGNPRVMTSDQALALEDIPEELLVVGGGYIGMELGTVYAALGSRIVLAEALPSILTGTDPDLVRPVQKKAQSAFKEIRLGAKVISMATSVKQIAVTMEVDGKNLEESYDRVLVSIGRVSNCDDLGLENTSVMNLRFMPSATLQEESCSPTRPRRKHESLSNQWQVNRACSSTWLSRLLYLQTPRSHGVE
jgi:dihydrolipoamide dehydrogenase